VSDALDAVIDAALERALLDSDDARRYFALAGALQRGRSATGDEGSGLRPRGPDDPPPTGDSTPDPRSDAPADVLGVALLSTAAVGALAAAGRDGIDAGAWSPGGADGGTRTELVAAGAAAAYRRFDVAPGTVAARSGLPAERFVRDRDGDVIPDSD
jgi:hypothetical protein